MDVDNKSIEAIPKKHQYISLTKDDSNHIETIAKTAAHKYNTALTSFANFNIFFMQTNSLSM